MFSHLHILLASHSPRRRLLLQQLGVQCTPVAVSINEHWDGKEDPEQYTRRLARGKAESVCEAARETRSATPLPILGGDTCVVIDGEILGKASNTAEATRMLIRLSGRSHQVYSAVALHSETTRVEISCTQVEFDTLSQYDIASYCASGEPLGKAGGYAIQGIEASFIRHIAGSYSGVMGLPLFETAKLLRSLNDNSEDSNS